MKTHPEEIATPVIILKIISLPYVRSQELITNDPD